MDIIVMRVGKCFKQVLQCMVAERSTTTNAVLATIKRSPRNRCNRQLRTRYGLMHPECLEARVAGQEAQRVKHSPWN